MSNLVIYVNSAIDRLVRDTTTSFTVNIDSEISTRNNIKMRLNQIELANAQPTFPFHANIFYYEISGVLFNISLNNGKIYSSGSDVVTDLSNGFTANGHSIAVTYTSSTNTISFTNNEATDTFRPVGSYRYSDNLATTPSNIADRIGLTQDTTNILLTNGQSITCSNTPRLLPSNCYFIVCKEITKSNNTVIPDANYITNGAIIARVTSGAYGTLSQLFFSQDVEYELPQQTLKRLTFEVVDDEYYPVATTSVPVTFSLILTIN